MSHQQHRRCALLLPALSPTKGSPTISESMVTIFKLIQQRRYDIVVLEKQSYSDIIQLISANLSGDGLSEADFAKLSQTANQQTNQSLPFSVFKVIFPVKSTYIVLSFLESRLPCHLLCRRSLCCCCLLLLLLSLFVLLLLSFVVGCCCRRLLCCRCLLCRCLLLLSSFVAGVSATLVLTFFPLLFV